MPMERVMVVEDDPIIRRSLELQLRQRRCEVLGADCLRAAREILAKDAVDLIFLDLRLPDGHGADWLGELQTLYPRPLVVVVTGLASVESAVDCMRRGAFEYVVKPFSVNQIEMVLEKAEEFSQMLSVNRFLAHQSGDERGWEMLGQSAAMEDLRQLVRQVGRTNATVLIQGESGTGKELVARALHQQSPRAKAPLIKVNCAAVPDTLIESEFFGHEKGAFTGALNKREGRFELAHGGTILLDEISEVPAHLQAKLLRVLQEREFERVGGSRTIRVDVRVIATTNRRLEESVARREFREDLFFRLNVVPVPVRPLRERKEDIPLLAEHFLRCAARQHGCGAERFSSASLSTLCAHRWPGNVRELQNVVERAAILAGADTVVEPGHLALTVLTEPGTSPTATPAQRICFGSTPASNTTFAASSGPDIAAQFPPLEEIERQHIFAALRQCSENRTHAARILGISVRTLRNKLSDYRLRGLAPLIETPKAVSSKDPSA